MVTFSLALYEDYEFPVWADWIGVPTDSYWRISTFTNNCSKHFPSAEICSP